MSVRFVIVCPARSGSWMLVTALQSHPQVLCHGEVLGGNDIGVRGLAALPHVRAGLARLRELNPVAFMRDVVLSDGSRAAVGCKIKYEELPLVRWRDAVVDLVADRALRIVMLWREDLLARYLSEHRATSITQVFNTVDDRDRPEVPALRLDPDACEASFSLTERRRERAQALFASHPTLEITYETLITDTAATFGAVQRFLDLDEHPIEPATVRLRRESLREAIANYDELADHFAGTVYEHYVPINPEGDDD